MSGVPKIQGGDLDITYEAVDANLVGGTVVIPSTTTTESGEQGIKAATAGATNVLGVCANDAVTAANRDALVNTTSGQPGAYPTVDASVAPATVTVYNNCITLVVYAAGTAVPYGAPIKATAGGGVTLFVIGTDPDAARIGWCAVKGGMGTGGGQGRARINV